MQTNPAVEQRKIIRWSESPWNQSCRKEKGLRRKGFAEEPSAKSLQLYSPLFHRLTTKIWLKASDLGGETQI